jgi:hypothetical protein
MNGINFTPDDVVALSALANGIIPPDERDGGAAAVGAGPRIAERARQGVNGPLYSAGLRLAVDLAREKFGRAVVELGPGELHELIGAVDLASPVFFRQLRADVCALYLSDAGVWQRIGFPGPSAETGGHPDFDQPQVDSGEKLQG